MRKLKQFFLTACLLTTMFQNTVLVSAATGTLGTDSIGNATSTEAAEDVNTVNVSGSVASKYLVNIPIDLTLDGSTKAVEYTVSVSGDIAGDLAVLVTPENTFTLKSAKKDDITATISQNRVSWASEDMGTEATGIVSAPDLTAGDWNGTFNFYISLEEFGDDIALDVYNFTNYNVPTTGDIVIPNYVEDDSGVKHRIASVNTAFLMSNKENITSFYVPDSVSGIRSNFIFNGFTNLTSVHLPNGITTISGGTFSGCSSLKDVNLPESLTTIGNQAFMDCVSLTNIEIPKNVVFLGTEVFANCINLASITFPDGLEEIGNSAFANCTGLTAISIPRSVTTIGNTAFQNCTGLTYVEIPNGVVGSSSAANFAGCTGITSAKIPANYAAYTHFAGCTALKDVTIVCQDGDALTSMFMGLTGIETATIEGNPSSITGTFTGCSKLTSVNIPDSVTKIGNQTFFSCRSLTNLVVPSTVTEIGENAFKDVPKVTYNGTAEGSPWGATEVVTE